jgi:hypothetical protein
MPSALTMKLIGGLAGLLILGGLVLGLKHYKSLAESRGQSLATICQATRDASDLPKLKCADTAKEIGMLGQAIADTKAKTAQAKADDAAHAKAVETHQNAISQESSDDYQKQLAAVRADYARRVRAAEAAAHSSGGGSPAVPGAAPSAARPDAAPAQAQLPAPDALTATEQAIQLKAMQDWACKEGLAVGECEGR